ncbi:MAG TPA: HEAT repeat domain-containing protein [Ktedonosporobacter sp.]|nr:HEAT repeat domain-containing protein [Ktedonosporobacter sp.]
MSISEGRDHRHAKKAHTGKSAVSSQQESTRAALALLLGPDTDYHIRVRATRRLARQGPAILPLLLTTLNHYPEITSPPWPWWPPQYEHCSRLLLYLSQKAQIPLEDFLQHPSLSQPIGPVLWTGIIEAAGLQPYENYEALLCRGLEMPWISVRYAAAMALANRARKVALQPTTCGALRLHQSEHEALPVRLTTSYALLNSREEGGLDTLIEILHTPTSQEARKAAAFLLATEFPVPLSIAQRERLAVHLLHMLQEAHTEQALYAAQALSKIALPSVLPVLGTLLESEQTQTQLMALTTLEEMTQQTSMRRIMRQQAIPTRLLPLLKSEEPDVRRQACYTLAACGGEYATAVLGTIVLNRRHIGHLEAIESLRLLQPTIRTPTRVNVVRWLLQILSQSQEEVQVSALDTLTYLLWQARTRRQKRAWEDMGREVILDGTTLRLLDASSALIRQRSVDLLRMLGSQLDTLYALHRQLLVLLRTDPDSGVRACVAYTCEQLEARWAMPDLILTLLDPDPHVAQTALNALSQLATPDDSIVLYVLIELTHDHPGDTLAQAARATLKKWRHLTHHSESKKKLHSSR